MATVQKTESKNTGMFSFGDQISAKKLSTKDIFSKMQMPSITNPIDPKRISKNLKSCLNTSSVIKAGFVFLGTVGIYYLTRTKNIFSYFGLEAKNSKDTSKSEVMKVKSGENALTIEKNLETAKQVDGSSINKITQTYESKAGVVEFKEVKVEEIKNSQKEGAEKRRSIDRRSINIKNPIPDQYVVVGKPFNLTIDGSHVFNSKNSVFLEAKNISTWLSSISIINSPLKGSYETPDWAQDVAISGNYAYVAAYKSGLQIIDITNPANPTFKGSYKRSDWAMGVAVFGNYAYVVSSNHNNYNLGFLRIIDITDPANPIFKGSHNTLNSACKVALSGNYAYVVGIDYDYRSGFLQIIDVTDPTNPIFKGSYDTPRSAHGVAVQGNYAYVAAGDGDSGLQIIDITNPANPTFKGSYDTPREAWGVAVSGNYAYVADRNSGLQIIDISNPSNPTFKGSYDKIYQALGVALSDNYAYVANCNSGLHIINISDPANPTFKGAYDTSGDALGVTLSDNYAYVAARDSGLQIIDMYLNSDELLLLSGTPSSVGVYRVDIEACNEIMECITDSFDIIVKGIDDTIDTTNITDATDLNNSIAIVSSMAVAACIACVASFSLPLIIGGVILMIRRNSGKVLENENHMKEKELEEKRDLQKLDASDDKKIVV
jgi:hypothetical protein